MHGYTPSRSCEKIGQSRLCVRSRRFEYGCRAERAETKRRKRADPPLFPSRERVRGNARPPRCTPISRRAGCPAGRGESMAARLYPNHNHRCSRCALFQRDCRAARDNPHANPRRIRLDCRREGMTSPASPQSPSAAKENRCYPVIHLFIIQIAGLYWLHPSCFMPAVRRLKDRREGPDHLPSSHHSVGSARVAHAVDRVRQ